MSIKQLMVMCLNIYTLCLTNIKDHSNYSLRSSANKKLLVPRTHHKSLSYTGVIIWNALPENIKSSETFTKFIDNIK